MALSDLQNLGSRTCHVKRSDHWGLRYTKVLEKWSVCGTAASEEIGNPLLDCSDADRLEQAAGELYIEERPEQSSSSWTLFATTGWHLVGWCHLLDDLDLDCCRLADQLPSSKTEIAGKISTSTAKNHVLPFSRPGS